MPRGTPDRAPFSSLRPAASIDYTRTGDNPAAEMTQGKMLEYLNDIIQTQPELALARITGIIDGWLDQGGITRKEAITFKNDLSRAQETGRAYGWSLPPNPAGAMQLVVMNFVMKAMDRGLQVYHPKSRYPNSKGMGLGLGLGMPAEDVAIRTMGNLMTEDGDYKINMDHDMMEAIRFINKQGFEVAFSEDLAGFDEDPMAQIGDGDPVDISMGAGEEPTPGGIGVIDVEMTAEVGAASATASMLDWAENNGCPPELCEAVRAELGEEVPCDEIPGEEIPGDEGPEPVMPGGEIEAPPGAGALRQRKDMPEGKKPSAGLTKKQKSTVAKKAAAGKDIGKPGKGFKKVEAAAKKSGAKDPAAVAGAAMWKNIKRG